MRDLQALRTAPVGYNSPAKRRPLQRTAEEEPSTSTLTSDPTATDTGAHSCRYGLAWLNRAINNCCKMCLVRGHFAKDCNTPHYLCTYEKVGKCMLTANPPGLPR